MKTRSGTKTITTDNKDKAKELWKALGINPGISLISKNPLIVFTSTIVKHKSFSYKTKLCFMFK